MRKLNFDAPFNSLSLGNVSLNFLRELIKKDLDLSLFPVGDRINLEAYDKLGENVKDIIPKLTGKRFKNFDRTTPTLRVWHINGSEKKIGDHQFLRCYPFRTHWENGTKKKHSSTNSIMV